MNRWTAVLLCCLLLTPPTGGIPPEKVPPPVNEPERDASETLERADQVVTKNDPDGQVPLPSTVRARSVVDTLENKFTSYISLFESGQLPKVPMQNQSLKDIHIGTGYLPNKTFFSGTGLGSLLNILEPPYACFDVTPDQGPTSTTFSFDATCSTDVQNSTRDLEVRWDWTGDGLWDTAWNTTKTIDHNYTTSGYKDATLQARDPDGFTSTTTVTILVNDPPDACFDVSPTSGTTETDFKVDATCSSDDLTATADLKARWDWQDDGAWDTSFSTDKTTSHRYSSTGSKTIRVEVKDEHGATSTTTHTVDVDPANTCCNDGGDGGSGGGGGGGGVCSAGGGSTCGNPDAHVDQPHPLVFNLRFLLSLDPFPEGTTSQDLNTTSPSETFAQASADSARFDPVLVQRAPGTGYQPALEQEVNYTPGQSLSFQPDSFPRTRALINLTWLTDAFGTYGSEAAFDTHLRNGTRYARIEDPLVLHGHRPAMQAIVLNHTALNTLGHEDMVRLEDQSAAIGIPHRPHWNTTNTTVQTSNGTRNETTSTAEGALVLRFKREVTASDAPESVSLDRMWLDTMGLESPAFRDEDGSPIPYTQTAQRYIVHPDHPLEQLTVNTTNLTTTNATPPEPDVPDDSFAATTSTSTTTTIGEAGVRGSMDNAEWNTASLSGSYSQTPHVFVTTQTTGGNQDPSAAHLRGVTTSSFETQHCEWDGSDTCDTHNTEHNGWMAVDPGDVNPIDGMETGTVSLDGNGNQGTTKTVSFSETFSSPPLVFVQSQTEEGNNEPLNSQVVDVSSTGFTVEFCEQEGTDDCDGHMSESIGWWAVHPSQVDKGSTWDWGTKDIGNSQWTSISFSQTFSQAPVVLAMVQTENGNQEALYPEVQSVDTAGAQIRYCEADGGDDCDSHNTETVAWIAAEPGSLDVSSSSDGGGGGGGGSDCGSSQFCDDFDDGSIDTQKWTVAGAGENDDCRYDSSPYALKFDGGSSRSAATRELDVSDGGSVAFDLKIGSSTSESNDPDCEDADSGEGIRLQYSTDGGSSWTTLAAYDTGSYTSFTSVQESIPLEAQTGSTKFRWRQSSFSGSTYDHWAIDDVEIDLSSSSSDSDGGTGTHYEEDFDDGASGWTFTGLWHVTSRRAYSDGHSAWYGQENSGDYDTGSTNSGSLISPTLAIPKGNPLLEFQSWYETEGGSYYDEMTVEIKPKGQSSWSLLKEIGGNMYEWQAQSISLEDHQGEDAKIRFRFDTRDSVYNDYEGWYVEDVTVRNRDKIVYTSNWKHSKVSGGQYDKKRHHDNSQETAYLINDPDDRGTVTFEVHKEKYEGTETAYLNVAGRSTDCGGSQDYTHTLQVNLVRYRDFDPCQSWSSSQYDTSWFAIPMSRLEDGTNRLTITSNCENCQGLWLSTDTDSTGQSSEIRVNGNSQSGSLIWDLWIYRENDYETLERYITYAYRQDDGSYEYEHAQETYTFFSPEDRESMFSRVREKRDGTRDKLWFENQLVKNRDYNSDTHRDGWDHYVLDLEEATSSDQGRNSPTSGEYYTWYRSQWEFRGSNGQLNRDRFMQLVPSNPASSTDKNGKQNPPPRGDDSDWDNSYEWNVTLESRAEGYEKAKDYEHEDSSDSDGIHYHDEWFNRFHILDWDKNPTFDEAVDIAEIFVKQLMTVLKNNGVSENTANLLKKAKVGTWIDMAFSSVQTGDIGKLAVHEEDDGGLGVLVARTKISSTPPSPMWFLPNLFSTNHWLPFGLDKGEQLYDWCRQFTGYDWKSLSPETQKC